MTKAHEEIIEFMAAGTTSERMAAFKPSARVKKRVAFLLAKEKKTACCLRRDWSSIRRCSSNI